MNTWSTICIFRLFILTTRFWVNWIWNFSNKWNFEFDWQLHISNTIPHWLKQNDVTLFTNVHMEGIPSFDSCHPVSTSQWWWKNYIQYKVLLEINIVEVYLALLTVHISMIFYPWNFTISKKLLFDHINSTCMLWYPEFIRIEWMRLIKTIFLHWC